MGKKGVGYNWAELLLSYPEETKLLCYTTKTCWPEHFDPCQSAAQDSRSAVPVSVSDGGGNLSPLSCGRLRLSVFKPTRHKTERGAQEALSAGPGSAQASYQSSGNGALSALSQLGCLWAQIFEQRLTAWVPLAEHHRIPGPKQKFWMGGEVGGEGVWMLGMCRTHVYTQASAVSLLPFPNLAGGLDKV